MESEHCPLGNSPCAPKGETVLGLDLKPKGPVSVLQYGGFFTQVFENIERVKESSPGLSWEISYKISFDSWASAEESPLSTWMLGFYDPGADVQLVHPNPPGSVVLQPAPAPIVCSDCSMPTYNVGKSFAFDLYLLASFVQSLLPVAPHTGAAGQRLIIEPLPYPRKHSCLVTSACSACQSTPE